MVALPVRQSNIIPFPTCEPEKPTQKSNEWYTPSRYIEAARRVMGSIDLDPASCALANETVRATRYYTKEENGLAQEWYGNVWCNPPYGAVNGKSQIVLFTKKLLDSYDSGKVTQAIFLAPARTEATWFYPLWQHFICFTCKRIYFYGPESKEEHFFGSCFVYLGLNEARFIHEFSAFGTIAKAIAGPRRETVQATLWEVQ